MDCYVASSSPRHSEKCVAPGKRLPTIYVTYPFVLSAQILSSIAKQAILSFGAGGQCPVASVAGVGAGHAPLNEAQITANHGGNKVRILIFSEVDSKIILKVKLMVVRYVTGSWEVPGLSPAY